VEEERIEPPGRFDPVDPLAPCHTALPDPSIIGEMEMPLTEDQDALEELTAQELYGKLQGCELDRDSCTQKPERFVRLRKASCDVPSSGTKPTIQPGRHSTQHDCHQQPLFEATTCASSEWEFPPVSSVNGQFPQRQPQQQQQQQQRRQQQLRQLLRWQRWHSSATCTWSACLGGWCWLVFDHRS